MGFTFVAADHFGRTVVLFGEASRHANSSRGKAARVRPSANRLTVGSGSTTSARARRPPYLKERELAALCASAAPDITIGDPRFDLVP